MVNHYERRPLPEELEPLADLVLDLRLSGSQFLARIFRMLDQDAWERTANPYMILLNVSSEQLQEAATSPDIRGELETWLDRRRKYMEMPGWFPEKHGDSSLKTAAYFSMEFGLSEALPIYSGGLGMLAGDHLKSASDLNVPVIGIGLLYQQGYFRQVLAADGWQLEAFPFNDPGTLPVSPVLDADGRWPDIRLELPGRTLLLRIWQVRVGKVKLYLLDSNHPLNSPWDRGITAQLYAAGREKRLLQEIVLGVGGWRLVEMLGLDVQVCHLNEGHAAFAVLARAAMFAANQQIPFRRALRITRAGNIFTTHTPVDAAFDKFEPELITKYAQPFISYIGMSMDELLALGRKNPHDAGEPFNMAYLAMRGCCFVNGVSRLHGRVSRRLFNDLYPGWPEAQIPVGSITNGIHVPTWDSEASNMTWKSSYKGDGTWMEHLDRAAEILNNVSDETIWDFRAAARKTLIEYVRRRLVRHLQERGMPEDQVARARHVLDPNVLTLGFARRFTEYKRPNLILHDAERFARILKNADRPVQMIVAGKAHPNDDGGKAMVQALARFGWRDDLRDRFVFLEDYDMMLAQNLAGGVDVWLNNPRRPAEACGTSGMKMLVNGGLHFSQLDGWWDEAYAPEVGWSLGERNGWYTSAIDDRDANELYEKLEQQIVPEFYNRDSAGIPRNWVKRIRASMSQLTPHYSSDRMVREYVEQCYVSAASAFLARSADNGRLGAEIEDWLSNITDNWGGLHFGNFSVKKIEDNWHFEVQAFLGDLPLDLVRVQLYADPLEDHQPVVVDMHMENRIPGAVNGYAFTAAVPAHRPAEHYTPRIIPHHRAAFLPLEDSHIFWRS